MELTHLRIKPKIMKNSIQSISNTTLLSNSDNEFVTDEKCHDSISFENEEDILRHNPHMFVNDVIDVNRNQSNYEQQLEKLKEYYETRIESLEIERNMYQTECAQHELNSIVQFHDHTHTGPRTTDKIGILKPIPVYIKNTTKHTNNSNLMKQNQELKTQLLEYQYISNKWDEYKVNHTILQRHNNHLETQLTLKNDDETRYLREIGYLAQKVCYYQDQVKHLTQQLSRDSTNQPISELKSDTEVKDMVHDESLNDKHTIVDKMKNFSDRVCKIFN
ncbi:hypothetical protein BC833DRAFT_566715 [Globomyces pollinis-pini]|nr:hypothetical protein BC833DRAFT_566715 [Globomyces pollinis-pini]